MNNLVYDTAYWNNLYQNQETAWDIGEISLPLKTYFDQLTDKNISILIPGCGNSYEAEYLLQQGFTNVTVIDISSLLTEKLKEKFGSFYKKELTIINDNFFNLQGKFDLIVEQTFFCALDPSKRKDYVNKMHELLKPNGKLAGVLFNRTFQDGPPFGGSKEEYEKLFNEKFEIKKMEACYNSIKPREGTELFIHLIPRTDL